ncbi:MULTISPECIES: NtaA/DmoA family FMN-dependent monooxygenase [Bacteria]
MTASTKPLTFGAFEVMSPAFLSNAWSHPLSQTKEFATLAFWQKLARRLDDGGFDYLFFADASGYPMNSAGEVPEAVIRESVQFPVLDQMSLVSGLAATVDRLGFVLTASTTVERPYVHARRFTTLDHLTNGRLGWNIVTSDMQESLTRLLGETEVMAHDLRYDRAEEFVDLCLELWETAWDDDAMVFDKARRVAIEPSAVRRITHHGTYFDFDGYYPANPSPQRTPTLMQAGTSPRGLRFAADFAEAVFVQKRDIPSAKAVVARVRDAAEAAGRSRDSVKVVNSVSVIVGDTEAEARELRRSLSTAPSTAAMAALYMGWSGVDLMQYDPEDTLDGVRSEVGQSSALKYQSPDGKSPTVREILDGIVETTGGFKITGTPSQCAAELEKIARETDLDGYLIECTFGGTVSYDAFIDKVVPLLRENGIMPAEPRGGTLRERLIGTPTPALSALPRPVLHPSQSI